MLAPRCGGAGGGGGGGGGGVGSPGGLSKGQKGGKDDAEGNASFDFWLDQSMQAIIASSDRVNPLQKQQGCDGSHLMGREMTSIRLDTRQITATWAGQSYCNNNLPIKAHQTLVCILEASSSMRGGDDLALAEVGSRTKTWPAMLQS